MRNWILLIAVAGVGCASPTPTLDDLPVRSPVECGRAFAYQTGSVDIAIAIDVSSTTRFPSRADIDGDGEVGRYVQSIVTDTDDSVLAAQVAGVRSLVHSVAPLGARVSLVTYSGPLERPTRERSHTVSSIYADTQTALTDDPAALDAGLERVLARGSHGGSDFWAGLRKSLDTLSVVPREVPEPRRFLLFLSDSPYPIRHGNYPLIQYPEKDHRIKIAAIRAIDANVTIHTFALGDAVDAEPPNTLSRIAGATGGVYTAVQNAANLHCDLLAAITRGNRPRNASGPLRVPSEDPTLGP